MSKKNEITIIISNIKKYFISYLIVNILTLGFSFYFIKQTKDIKTEFISIKLVTDDFPDVEFMLENIKSYIEFTTDYKLDLNGKSITNSSVGPINISILEEVINKYIDNYHDHITSIRSSIKHIPNEQKAVSAIDFYFEKIKPFDQIFKLSDSNFIFKYKPINYLTLLFTLLISLNFFTYIFILFIGFIKKNK